MVSLNMYKCFQKRKGMILFLRTTKPRLLQFIEKYGLVLLDVVNIQTKE